MLHLQTPHTTVGLDTLRSSLDDSSTNYNFVNILYTVTIGFKGVQKYARRRDTIHVASAPLDLVP